ncbi:MAG TPA: ROK family protein [Pseudolysinimonas sp.]|jgi:predicted NBD/HSP70 family sugar kinase|nr:ROK family protein [Pseudolysinimonas sp.]
MRIATPAWVPATGAARAVALEVLLHGPISRSAIARTLDLSQGSLTRLSAPLIASGLLVEGDERAEGRAGRPTRPLDVIPSSRHFIGLKVTADEVLGVRTDLRATVVARDAVALPARDPDAVADTIVALVRDLSADVSITAVGVGIGGRVGENGVIRSAPFLEWEDVPLGAMLEARAGLPVVIDNDLVAFTEYEHWFGAGRDLDRFAVVTLGAGIGYGLVINRQVIVDEDSGLGLVGHWPLDPFGPRCPAGHRGCAMSVLTADAITGEVSSALGRTVGYAEALELAAAGDPAARRVIDDAGHGLGRLLAAIANLTAPELVILGGEGVGLVDVASEAIQEGLAADRDPRVRPLGLVTTSGDNIEWCRGAAVLAIQRHVLGDDLVQR